MRLEDLGLDRRLLAVLAAGTLVAAGVGWALAAGLDSGPARSASAEPVPAPAPEAQDDAPLGEPPILPPVTVAEAPDAAPVPDAIPAPGAPDATPPDPTPATAAPPPPAPATTVQAVPAPTPSTGATTGRATPTTAAPFRPRAASTRLAEFVVPAAGLPADAATAARSLKTVAAAGTASPDTMTDIGYVLRLQERFGASPLPGRRATVARIVRLNAWWFARRASPRGRVLVRDPDGLIYSYSAGHGFAVNPVGTAGRWQGMNDDISGPALAEALMSLGVSQSRGGRAAMTWEYFDVPGRPAEARPGVSGMAQARVGQLLAGAYGATGDLRFARAAGEAIAALAVPVDAGGALTRVAPPGGGERSPWYVERAFPGGSPWLGGALNGFMVAILELRTAERALLAGPPEHAAEVAPVAVEARRLADEGAASLERFLPLHDSGRWSFYGLLTPGHPWRTYLANETYHCYHVALLVGLSGDYPELSFGATARKWRGYAARAGVACPGGGTSG